MKSALQFQNYKIDVIELHSLPRLDVLISKEKNDDAEFQFSIKKPIYYKKIKSFVIGLELLTKVYNKNKEEILTCKLGISGFFSLEDENELNKELMEKIVKTNLPAIMLPYLRSTLTVILANAGFGTIILPLINLNKAIQDSSDFEIIIEE